MTSENKGPKLKEEVGTKDIAIEVKGIKKT